MFGPPLTPLGQANVSYHIVHFVVSFVRHHTLTVNCRSLAIPALLYALLVSFRRSTHGTHSNSLQYCSVDCTLSDTALCECGQTHPGKTSLRAHCLMCTKVSARHSGAMISPRISWTSARTRLGRRQPPSGKRAT